jgi:hypothetical protein
MKKALAITSGSVLAFALPLIAAAQSGQTLNNVSDVGQFIINMINNVFVPVLFAVAFIVFIWGAFNTFILGATSEETKEKGKSLMLYGLIGFFVMVSVWGLVNILTGTFNFGKNTQGNLPTATGVGQ